MSTVKLKAPDNAADHFSCGGEEFKADKNGVFEVPSHVAQEMIPHGFFVVQDVAPKAEKAAK